ncbi:hypothetical protein [Arenibacter amylolyticus]|uniref:hypothetical protein n=1 Tax=Arenibacter amylolyticus TaxID=1406873 RepID=UPI000A3CD595|nr:hypothetical protein [Arenibacter amylolyticus]
MKNHFFSLVLVSILFLSGCSNRTTLTETISIPSTAVNADLNYDTIVSLAHAIDPQEIMAKIADHNPASQGLDYTIGALETTKIHTSFSEEADGVEQEIKRGHYVQVRISLHVNKLTAKQAAPLLKRYKEYMEGELQRNGFEVK